jgi:hypothetical protein
MFKHLLVELLHSRQRLEDMAAAGLFEILESSLGYEVV